MGAQPSVKIRTARRVEHGSRPLPSSWPRVQLAGVTTDLLDENDAVSLIIDHAMTPHEEVLAVVSANLDHLHHFGSGRTSARRQRQRVINLSIDGRVEWLTLLDGAPLVRRAGELTGRPWPRLAGSDMIWPLLDEAERQGLSVGFLGGSPETHQALAPVMAERWPTLRVGGYWAPTRSQLDDEYAAAALTRDIRAAGVDILAVCLGKPRQERWIATHAHASGAAVCLAFGAVVDFLAGRVNRAPDWIADHGLEWAWRLANEPRRLTRRYLIQGPPAYVSLRRDSYVKMATTYFSEPAMSKHPVLPRTVPTGEFAPAHSHVDVAVIAVTHNSADDIEPLISSVRRQLDDQSMRMIVVDNASTDDTLDRLSRHPDVIAVPTGANLGYAGGINVALKYARPSDAVLVVNPDLELAPESVRTLRDRLARPGVGVVLPRLLEANGELYASIRREPSLARVVGDSLFGERLRGRSGLFSEIELDPRRYRQPHAIDWGTGAAMLVDADLAWRVGSWDESYFLYSEEVDFLRRVRELGAEVWFEPDATMQHRRGGSGASDRLEALLAVNKVRYYEAWHGAAPATAFRATLVLASLLRLSQSRHRTSLRYLLDRSSWPGLVGDIRGGGQ
ncbi:WecB/TagA/CpsF family glycosyltransferase [Actinopolymorpha sp. NPDC004070]|uniref:WecB/TagA/CpsF family glycosyltransferase n=1 Tax=Actinopolymorpha sp. NPDC004070 TaxID=3154548 RepID=UPI0033AF2733